MLCIDWIYWIIAFTVMFQVKIGNLYVANVIVVLHCIFRSFYTKEKLRVDRNGLTALIMYLGSLFLSMAIFVIQYKYASLRNIIQFLYNFQYIILIIDGTLDKRKLRLAMKISAYFLAGYIIFLWVTKTGMQNIVYLLVENRLWASAYVEGWPNSTPIPLLFGTYLCMEEIFRKKKIVNIIPLILILFALLLCTSRTGYLGMMLIIAYFLVTRDREKNTQKKITSIVFAVFAILLIIFLFISFVEKEQITGRMFMVNDRESIFSDVFDYLCKRPILGYGGNSFDVVYSVVEKSKSGINWGHCHNTILELLIRSGFVGTCVFFILIYRSSTLICDTDEKVFFYIFWFLSLFQIYYRNFTFLFILYSVIPSFPDYKIGVEEQRSLK